MVGLGANLPKDAIYPHTTMDDQGKQLHGANKCIIHFPKGQTPPVPGFWALTMYGMDQFLGKKYYFYARMEPKIRPS